ncbi:MAG: hypothetical protein ACPGO5_04710 [Patescibacteria group bacterium]
MAKENVDIQTKKEEGSKKDNNAGSEKQWYKSKLLWTIVIALLVIAAWNWNSSEETTPVTVNQPVQTDTSKVTAPVDTLEAFDLIVELIGDDSMVVHQDSVATWQDPGAYLKIKGSDSTLMKFNATFGYDIAPIPGEYKLNYYTKYKGEWVINNEGEGPQTRVVTVVNTIIADSTIAANDSTGSDNLTVTPHDSTSSDWFNNQMDKIEADQGKADGRLNNLLDDLEKSQAAADARLDSLNNLRKKLRKNQ